MIVSFKNQATEDIFNGKNSKLARKLTPAIFVESGFQKVGSTGFSFVFGGIKDTTRQLSRKPVR